MRLCLEAWWRHPERVQVPGLCGDACGAAWKPSQLQPAAPQAALSMTGTAEMAVERLVGGVNLKAAVKRRARPMREAMLSGSRLLPSRGEGLLALSVSTKSGTAVGAADW